MGANMSAQPKWSEPLCGCGNNMGTCCIAWCLPCVTFGQIAEVLDEGRTTCCAHGCIYGVLMACSIQWLYSCFYREKLRHKFGLPAEPCGDCLVHWCCGPCALCQEYVELKKRGWIGAPNMPPRMQTSMYK